MFNIVRPHQYVNMESDKKYQKLITRIASNVRKARLRRKLTQENMTEFGFNYRHYQKIESGKYSFTLHTLNRLAIIFRVDIKEFFE